MLAPRHLTRALAAAVVFVGTPFIVTTLVAPSSARAQSGLSDGVVFGDVIDAESGAPLAGVVVVATSPSLQGAIRVTTNADGRFRADGLPPGTYTLTLMRDGYSFEPVGDIQMRAGATLRIDTAGIATTTTTAPTPTPAAGKRDGGKTIRVTAGRPVVDVGSTQSGGLITDDMTHRVPLVSPAAKGGAQRSFEAAAQAMPQVQNDTYGASINGATSVENQYVIDGVGVNNAGFGTLGSPLSLEFIEEVGVITGGYQPEFGRSMGGVLNVVTKSGGNEFKGSVFSGFTPGAIEGDRSIAPNEGSVIRVVPALDYVADTGFELGGPLIQDRLWFYVGGSISQQQFKLHRSLVVNNATLAGSSDDYVAQQTNLQALGKLTWLVDDNQRVSLTFIATPSQSGGAGQIGIDPSTGLPESSALEGTQSALGHIYDAGALDATLKWQASLLERRLRLDTTLGWHHETSTRLPSDGSQIGDSTGLASIASVVYRRSNPGFRSIAQFETVPADSGCEPADTESAEKCPVTSYFLGGPDFLSSAIYDRMQGRSVASWAGELAGLHLVKFGAEFAAGQYDLQQAYSGGRRYRENGRGTLWLDNRQFGYLQGPDDAVILEQLRATAGNLTAGAFLQDSWTVGDVVTLNAGLRWDGEWLFAGDGSVGMSQPLELAPRLGVIVDPFKNGKVKVFGSFARYYQAIPLDIAQRSLTGDPEITSARPQAVCDPSDPAQAQGACLDDANRIALNDVDQPDQKWIAQGAGRTAIDPQLQAPSSDELSLGAEAEVARDTRIGAVYTRRWIGCPFDGAESIGDGMLCTRSIEDMSRDEANTYFIGNPGFGIASDFPLAQRNYDALTLMYTKQWSDGWLGQASYTYSWLRGNYAGLFRPETGQLDPFINSDFDLQSLTVNRNGNLPFDKTHQLKVYGAREFEAKYDTLFTLGAAAQTSTGAPTNYLGSHPLYGGGEVFVLPRGSGERLARQTTVDLHGGFTFHPAKAQAVEFTLDVFNVLNAQDAVAVDENYTNADVNPLQDCVAGQADSCTRDDLGKVQDIEGTPLAQSSVNPNFGQPTAFQTPRQVRVGLRWTF